MLTFRRQPFKSGRAQHTTNRQRMLCEVRLLLTPTLVWLITMLPFTLGGVPLEQRQWQTLQGQRRPRHYKVLPKRVPAAAVPIPTGPVHRNGLSPFILYPGKGVPERVQGPAHPHYMRGLTAAIAAKGSSLLLSGWAQHTTNRQRMLCEVRLLLTPTLVWLITMRPFTLGGVPLEQRQRPTLQGQRRPRHHKVLPKRVPAAAVPIPTGPVHRNGLSPFFRYPGRVSLKGFKDQPILIT
jgi:RsiW-degrading membrane proteinase PrsW (M82 family)